MRTSPVPGIVVYSELERKCKEKKKDFKMKSFRNWNFERKWHKLYIYSSTMSSIYIHICLVFSTLPTLLFRIHQHICRLWIVYQNFKEKSSYVSSFFSFLFFFHGRKVGCNTLASRVRVVIDPENSFPDRPFAPWSSSPSSLLSLSNFVDDEPGA